MASALRRCKTCLKYKDPAVEFTRERWVCNTCPASSENDFLTYTYRSEVPGQSPVAVPVAHSAAAAAILYGRTAGVESPSLSDGSASPGFLNQEVTTYVRADGTTVVNKPGNYRQAWSHRVKEPTWSGKVREPLPRDASPSPKFSSGSPTKQAPSSPKKEVILLEAEPTRTYENLAGVRVIRAIQPGVVKVERKTIEYPLLPAITETRILKADPLDIHPIGTRQHPAKVMPERNGFQVSQPVVAHVDGIHISNVTLHLK